MAYFKPIEELHFFPEAYLPNAAYIPSYFQPERETVDATNLQLQLDSNGLTSIIKLIDNNGNNITPFIDLSRYDTESKDWVWYDDEGLFYRLTIDDETQILTRLYPTSYRDITRMSDALNFDKDSIELFSIFNATTAGGSTQNYFFYKYAPLIVTVNNRPLQDISDYSNIRASDNLNRVDPDKPEFYYDFEGTIYTNQNLAGVSANNIKVHYFKAGENSISISCRLSSNAGSASYVTPKVDSYIVKLKGQYLRS